MPSYMHSQDNVYLLHTRTKTWSLGIDTKGAEGQQQAALERSWQTVQQHQKAGTHGKRQETKSCTKCSKEQVRKKSQTATPDSAVEWQSCPRSPGQSSSASRALVAPSCTTEGENCIVPLYFFSITQCTHASGMSCHVICIRSANKANRTARLVKKTYYSHHGTSCVFILPGYQVIMGHRLPTLAQR